MTDSHTERKENINKELANLIRTTRLGKKPKKMTIKQLSEKTGISTTHLTRIELGERSLSNINDMVKISRALDIPLLDMLKILKPEEFNDVCPEPVEITRTITDVDVADVLDELRSIIHPTLSAMYPGISSGQEKSIDNLINYIICNNLTPDDIGALMHPTLSSVVPELQKDTEMESLFTVLIKKTIKEYGMGEELKRLVQLDNVSKEILLKTLDLVLYPYHTDKEKRKFLEIMKAYFSK